MDYAVPRTGGDARPAIDDGQALGGKGTGIAAPQTLINAILDRHIGHTDRVQRAVVGARMIKSARAGRRRAG
jgi:hypothetical protein